MQQHCHGEEMKLKTDTDGNKYHECSVCGFKTRMKVEGDLVTIDFLKKEN